MHSLYSCCVLSDILHFQYFKLLGGAKWSNFLISNETSFRYFYMHSRVLLLVIAFVLFFLSGLSTGVSGVKHHIHCLYSYCKLPYRKWHFFVLFYLLDIWNKSILIFIKSRYIRPSQTRALHEVKSHVGKHHKSEEREDKLPFLQFCLRSIIVNVHSTGKYVYVLLFAYLYNMYCPYSSVLWMH